ncbi:class I SAM-dependent methyltransferase [Vibrio algarum]|uniref:Class I SAM-dependent methyltransferase n=1 Tax=Vibrio algarum TaxID=3020714 RepID=A0ABT4YLZ9_9VIBR|nr:class I SAM-dependent methyltransferase [Vibrio sp. KJ40-1]MDB1122432.1 class I SAM-dependent methyltransferase [Vibrio sp. KJ40-1]
MNNLLMSEFRKELLKTDCIPKELSHISLRYKELFLLDIENGNIELEEVTKCQCGCDFLEELAKIDRFALPFGSYICKKCGLVITSPRIKSASLPLYYDKYYHPLNYGQEHLEEQEALFEVGQGKKIFNVLKDFLPAKKTLKVLEVGAGTGNVLSELKDEALKYDIEIDELGTEYNQDCIDKAKKLGVNIIYGDLATAEKYGETFDVVILSHVFEHFIDLEYEVNLIKRLIKPDSLLYIEVPGILDLHNKKHYNRSFLGYLIHAHMYNFTMYSLSNLLFSFGFKPIFLNNKVESIFQLGEYYQHENEYVRVLNYLELISDLSFFDENQTLRRWHDSEKEKAKNTEDGMILKKKKARNTEDGMILKKKKSIKLILHMKT